MEYNTEREKIVISEYGRNIQVMIRHLMEIEDRKQRTEAAYFIVNVMAQMNPQVKESNDYMHKLWDHLYIISNYELDVDSPYPAPTPEMQKKKPDHVGYQKNNIRYGHYGQYIYDVWSTTPVEMKIWNNIPIALLNTSKRKSPCFSFPTLAVLTNTVTLKAGIALNIMIMSPVRIKTLDASSRL